MASSAVLLEQLKNSDPGLRRRAVRELVKFPEQKEVVDALCEALGDPNKGVQNITIETLSSMMHENTVHGLISVVKSSDLNTRNAGMTILRNLGPMAIAPLVKAIGGAEDVDEIIQILVILGDIHSPLATDTVLKYIDHADDNVKTTAVESLGKIQDPKAVDILVETYKNSDILKYSIVEALGNISVDSALPVLLGSLESGDILEYFTAIGAMGSMESPAGIDPLFKKLVKEEDSGTRRLIFKSLAQIEDACPGSMKKLDQATIKPVLLALLENQDAAEYRFLVRVAASLNDEAYAGALLSALQCPESEIADIAFEGIVNIGKKAVKPALEKIGRVEPPVAVRILQFLEKFPAPETPAAISLFVSNPDDLLRQALARTLGANPSDSSFSSLKELLNDPDEIVRRNAVAGIARMLTYDGALTALINKFKDINGHVRREACLAMAGSTSSQLVEPLFNVVTTEAYGDVREAAASVLALRKDPAITKRLLEMLDSDNSRIRETISRTIWQCGSTLAVDSLIQKLNDKEWRVVVNSCYSLENMKDLKSIFPLKELLKNADWQIRIAAISALRAFRSKELKQFFVPLLGDENPQVAKLAVVALSELGDKSLDVDLQKHIKHNRWEVRYQIVKALGTIKSQGSVSTLAQMIEKDESNAVRARAILTLSKIGDKKPAENIFKVLDSSDQNLVIAAIKFFKDNGESNVNGLEAKIKEIFLRDTWVKNYFIQTFAQNKSDFLEKILKAVVSPRQARLIDRLKASQAEDKGMNDEEALLLREIVAQKCGVEIRDKKTLEQKLARNLGRFFITSWIEYYHCLRYGAEDGSDLLVSLYDSITNPVTEFFGEARQSSVLVSTILPELIENRVKDGADEIKVLCCGVSFGPEAYSMAMSVLEDLHSDKAKVRVVGTDISHICLNTAKRGIYKREMFRQVDQKYTDLYFEDDRGDLRVKDQVKNLVDFKYANALSAEAMEELGEFDVVICRNLFSDFSQKAKERMAENIYNILVPGGVLLIGGKETLYNVTKAFRLQTFDKVVAYRKL
ncbi:MAG: HEAT repeat domain-containing protein [Candidatus Riflebacteria bacterium]|nr:HEAT repeat domain-containing protein [Candidatus Riflebacteria bacterium]